MSAAPEKRPWVLAVMVNKRWLQFKVPARFRSANTGKNYADRAWRGAYITLTHDDTKVRWIRSWGSWTREEPPEGPDPRTAQIDRLVPS